MAYRVLKFFTDLQDHDHPYHEGDIFPREGLVVSEERLAELSGTANKRGCALIAEEWEIKNSEELEKVIETINSKPMHLVAYDSPVLSESEKEALLAVEEAPIIPEPEAPKKKRGRKPKNA